MDQAASDGDGETMTMQPAGTATTGNAQMNSPKYQFLLVFLLSLNFGIVFFDRNSLNFLMPFVGLPN